LKIAGPEALEREQIEAAQRDPRQFGVLYENNLRAVFSYVARRLPSRQEAEDVTSEVFHQALAGLQTFCWEGRPFVAWLLGIAAHLIAKRWQQIGRSTVVAEEIDVEGHGLDAERQAMYAQLVERLPEDQRRVIERRFVYQQSIREIAQELGRSEGAVKQLQFRALENLRNQVRRPS